MTIIYAVCQYAKVLLLCADYFLQHGFFLKKIDI